MMIIIFKDYLQGSDVFFILFILAFLLPSLSHFLDMTEPYARLPPLHSFLHLFIELYSPLLDVITDPNTGTLAKVSHTCHGSGS